MTTGKPTVREDQKEMLKDNSTEGGTRTHTPLRAPDFESGASAIPPLRHTKEKHSERE